MTHTESARVQRITRRCIKALLLGLVLNLLVAWGLSLIPHKLGPGDSRAAQVVWRSPDDVQESLYTLEHKWFGVLEHQYHNTRRSRFHGPPRQISLWWTWRPFEQIYSSRDEARAIFSELNPTNPDASVASRTRFGFPALSLYCNTMIDDSAPLPNGEFATWTRGGFFDRIDSTTLMGKPSVWPHAQHIWLPYRPIWSGLVINTLIYALVWMMISYLYTRVRNAQRMLRGRCPFCAYEHHHDFTHGCPECGWRKTPPTPENNTPEPLSG